MERNIVARAREGQLYLGYRIFLLISTEHTHGIGKRNMKKCFLFHCEDQKEKSWKLKYYLHNILITNQKEQQSENLKSDVLLHNLLSIFSRRRIQHLNKC